LHDRKKLKNQKELSTQNLFLSSMASIKTNNNKQLNDFLRTLD